MANAQNTGLATQHLVYSADTKALHETNVRQECCRKSQTLSRGLRGIGICDAVRGCNVSRRDFANFQSQSAKVILVSLAHLTKLPYAILEDAARGSLRISPLAKHCAQHVRTQSDQTRDRSRLHVA